MRQKLLEFDLTPSGIRISGDFVFSRGLGWGITVAAAGGWPADDHEALMCEEP
jgi:hypothetical protein